MSEPKEAYVKRVRACAINALRAAGQWPWRTDDHSNAEIAALIAPGRTWTKASALAELERFLKGQQSATQRQDLRPVQICGTSQGYRPKAGGTKEERRASLPRAETPPPPPPDGVYWLDTGWGCGAVEVRSGAILHPSIVHQTAPIFRTFAGRRLSSLPSIYRYERLLDEDEPEDEAQELAQLEAQRWTTYEYLIEQTG